MIQIVLVLLICWGLGLFLLFTNGRHLFARSVGIVLLVGGCGSASVILHDFIPIWWPDLYRSLGDPGRYAAFAGNAYLNMNWFETSLFWLTLLLAGTTLYALSYAFLLSAIHFDHTIPAAWRTRLSVALGIPALAPFAWQLLQVAVYPAYNPNGVRIGIISGDPAVVTGIGYLFAGTFLYVRACMKERDPAARPQKLRAAAIVSIPVVAIYMFDFIAIRKLIVMNYFNTQYRKSLILFNDMNTFHTVVVAAVIVTFFIFVMRYGLLGLKLRLDKDRLDTSLRAMTAGTRMFNHTVKNEVSKINYIGERLKQHIENGDKDAALRMVSGLERISAHMLDMTGRIKEKTDDIVLREHDGELNPLIESTLASLLPLAEERGISFAFMSGSRIRLRCDKTHVAEAVGNLCLNAVEAIRAKSASGAMAAGGGKVTVSVSRSGNDVIVAIADNGVGIPKTQWGTVFEPFYTTKNNASNYGIGLSYCYAVMQKHGGTVYIAQSEPGVGTTIALRFPAWRASNVEIALEERKQPVPHAT
ncbi:sensor histidine kinase [Paenibacillus sp. MBLB4367]|uniref:sensor histidine kinase n=1 Tax=Paenibacillus sp. MBLB4367 TaxID=3384767 RepID=UPI003908088C